MSADAVEFTIDYIVSHQMGKLRPFAVGGAGFFITIPASTPYGNNTSVRGAYVAGGGLDYSISDHLGIRLQYRETFYKGVLTTTGEPMGGVFYRF